MNYIVYEVRNKANGKIYIGKHQTDNIYDNYLGSGKYLKRAINKYGKDCFEKTVLHVFDNKKDMDDKESELVTDEYLKSGNTYNLKRGDEGGWDYLNDGSKDHIERCKKGRITADIKLKEKYGENYKSIISMLGIDKRLESWAHNGSPDIKQKRSEIAGNVFKGKRHSEETKRKMSEKHTGLHEGQKNSQFGTCWIYNIIENKKIIKSDLDYYLKQGWFKGRKNSKKNSKKNMYKEIV